MDGIILIDKEKGYTSRDIVNMVGKCYQTRKVGHTGTLDPMATGVLVICVGKATKLVELLTSTTKEYVAEITLGLDTDTLDTEGTILECREVKKTEEEIDTVLSSFIKTYQQEVPKYSAVKVAGKKLYEYARQNENVMLPKKEVTIYDSKRISDVIYKDGKTIFQVKCIVSKGTYIRSLIRDISNELGTVGVMSALRRTRQGQFTIDECYQLSDLHVKPKLRSIVDCLEYPVKEVEGTLEEMIRNGRKLKNTWKEDKILFVTRNRKALGIYEVSSKDPTLLVPMKMILE